MNGRFGGQCKVAMVGYAQSRIYRRAPVPLGALTLKTCADAIADAGLRPEQIDGLSTTASLPAAGAHTNIDGMDIVTSGYVGEHLRIRPRWLVNHQGGGGAITSAVVHAVNAIAAGAVDYALVHRALHNPPGRYHQNPLTRASQAAQWTAPYGKWGVANIALHYMEYMQRYRATREEMATLAVTVRQNVQNNPMAYWHGTPLTVEDYMNARPIADPISLLDCDIPIDAAAAFVLTSAERARDLRHKPVYIAGYVQGQPSNTRAFRTLDDIMEGGMETGKTLWESAGLGPEDVDVPQPYDGFTPLVYFWLESLGFCPRGEAHSFIQGGAIDVKGRFPLLSGGGNQGNGRLHGVSHLLECYLQLSRRAGGRQLAQATVGLACQAYPDNGGAIVFTAEPL